MAEEGLNKKRQDFEDTQLQKLDTSVDHTNPDEVLRVANDIRIISDKVFTDINSDKKLKKALSAAFIKTFSKAESEARAEVEIDENIPGAEKEKVARARAFRKAFRSVYGRFVLEQQDDALDVIGKSSADTLKDILKFPIENKDKLKGRSELKSALSRLRKASLAANDPEFENRIVGAAFPKAATGADIKRLEREHHEAEHAEHHLQDVYKYFSTSGNFKKITTSYHDLSALTKGVNFDEKDEKDTLNKRISKKNQEIKGKTVRRDYLAKILAKVSDNKEDKTEKKAVMSEGDVQKNTDAMGDVSAEISAAEEELEQLNEIRTMSKSWKTDLTKLVENLEGAHHAKVPFGFKYKDKNGVEQEASLKEIANELKAINPASGNFNPSSLINLYEKLGDFFENHQHEVDHLLEKFDKASADAAKATKDAKKNLDKANAEVEKGKNLTDTEAAKKIIGALVWEQFPKLTPMDHNKLVSMILADDVATLQTDEGYEALAQRGSAQLLEDAKFVGFRAKLLNFKFKEGEKVTHPFKGLKPDDFKDWANIEKLFLSGKLNYKNAFFVLAAFEEFDDGVKSIQSVQLGKKLKNLLAKQMGVDEHMDKAGISKIVDDAFKAQMEKVRPIMKAHSETVDNKGVKAGEHKKKVLDMKYEDLNDQLRAGKISQKVYKHKLESLVKEASEAEANVEFSADSAGAQFWNSPEAQWLRDKSYDTGAFLGKKALAVGAIAPLKIVGSGLLGGAKLGASLGFQTAMMPFRAAKYPLLLAAKPLVGLVNLFRSNKWTPLPGIMDSIRNDAGRVVGYTKDKATWVVRGTAETVTKTTAGEWGKVKFEGTKYADRNKDHADERAEMMKVHEPKSDIDPVEVAESPFISFDKYHKQIEMVTKALGISIHAPGGHDVKVGHEEKADAHAKKDEHSAPGAHGSDHSHGAEAKKDAHGHGHEAPKKDAGGHH